MDNLIKFVEKFALDIIGTVLPGSIFIFGTFILAGEPQPYATVIDASKNNLFLAIFVILVSYAAGHFLCSIGEKLVEPLFLASSSQAFKILNKIESACSHLGSLISFAKNLTPNETPKYENLTKKIVNSVDVKAFAKKAAQISPNYGEDVTAQNFNSYRYLALSVSPESNQLSYKFMFISLMCLGLSTASLIIGFTMIIAGLRELSITIEKCIVVLFLLTVIPHFLMLRRYDFYRRSLSCPFSSAIISLDAREKNIL